ncbi:hypothetical protein ACHWQZ_G002181 [Mnemiopsis leidyi]
MFQLIELRNNVGIRPSLFKLEQTRAIKEVLNAKLANKVLFPHGLCIALHDIVQIGESFSFPGDAGTYTSVQFRYIVFRPFEEEVIIGKVRRSSPDGVWVTLGFFEDIFIPETYLQSPHKFDPEENCWVWEYTDGLETHNLYMDEREEIRFRVVKVEFNDVAKGSQAAADSEELLPMKIIGTISEPGLGLLSWWKEDNI